MFATAMCHNAATARAAAGSDARFASILYVIMGAVILASIFVVLRVWALVSVLPVVLVSVLVRIISGLAAPTNDTRHSAMSQT